MDDPESIEFATKFDAEYRKHLAEEKYRKEHPVVYTPKCPTCGCPDLDKIGAGGEGSLCCYVWVVLKKNQQAVQM